MKSAQYVIGIDGGGTKTAAMIADVEGSVIAQHVSGPSNVHAVGVEKAAKLLFSLVRECCDSLKVTPGAIRATTIGLAGAGRPEDQKRIADSLRKLSAQKKIKLKNLRIESDARIALEGAFRGGAGIILIAGTGSIAFGKDEEGNVHRVGGWGRILGDEGGGYFIGQRALVAACRQLDGRSSASRLTELIAKKFGLKTAEDIIGAVYRKNFEISTIAPIVLEAAEEGDVAASEIIQIASLELTDQARALVAKIHYSKVRNVQRRISLTFVGGLISNENPLTRALRGQIVESLPEVNIVTPMAPPVYGAVVMALS